ncbi:MAG TPA: hypothetical protein VJN02_07355 [Gammaproteobacteria bacterium]|nr:hypothetical protein [Gammaproteobacteria bacterium]
MAIIIRAFNRWTHVSAESTAKGFEIYLSAGSDVNDLASENEAQYRDSGYVASNLGNSKIVSDGDNKFLEIKIKDQTLQLPIHIIKDDQQQNQLITKFLIDRSNTTEILKKTFPTLDDRTINILINELCNKYFTVFGSNIIRNELVPSYHQIELNTHDDKITIPTIQDRYSYGLDENNFRQYVVTKVDLDEFNIRQNNCADHVIRALGASDTQHVLGSPKLLKLANQTYIHLGITKIRNPNIWVFGKTTIDYARAIREEILYKTIHDPNELFTSIEERVKQVLRMEISRLEDGERNIRKNSMFLLFRAYSATQKAMKHKALQTALGSITDDTSAIKQLNQLLEKNSAIMKGITRHKTRDHLIALQEALATTPSRDFSQTKRQA